MHDDFVTGECTVNTAFRTAKIQVMQYTGIKDRNGKEVYEGDLIKTRYRNRVKEVIWDYDINGFSSLYRREDGSNLQTSLQHPHNWPFEIIGNIYEDSHLLKD
jgi:uncharacterized phage protein (TIGR01671 family)